MILTNICWVCGCGGHTSLLSWLTHMFTVWMQLTLWLWNWKKKAKTHQRFPCCIIFPSKSQQNIFPLRMSSHIVSHLWLRSCWQYRDACMRFNTSGFRWWKVKNIDKKQTGASLGYSCLKCSRRIDRQKSIGVSSEPMVQCLLRVAVVCTSPSFDLISHLSYYIILNKLFICLYSTVKLFDLQWKKTQKHVHWIFPPYELTSQKKKEN